MKKDSNMDYSDIVQLEDPIFIDLDKRVGDFVWDHVTKQFVPIDNASNPIYAFIARSGFEDKGWDRTLAKLQLRLAKAFGDINITMMMETQLDYAEDRERKENLHAMQNQSMDVTLHQAPGSKFKIRHFT